MIKDERRESEIQASIVKLLKGFGFTVLVTSRGLQRGSSAIQKGIPDLLVSIPSVPFGWVGLEVKTAKGKVRPEQQVLHNNKEVAIVRNEAQACYYLWLSWGGSIAHSTMHDSVFKYWVERQEYLDANTFTEVE